MRCGLAKSYEISLIPLHGKVNKARQFCFYSLFLLLLNSFYCCFLTILFYNTFFERFELNCVKYKIL